MHGHVSNWEVRIGQNAMHRTVTPTSQCIFCLSCWKLSFYGRVLCDHGATINCTAYLIWTKWSGWKCSVHLTCRCWGPGARLCPGAAVRDVPLWSSFGVGHSHSPTSLAVWEGKIKKHLAIPEYLKNEGQSGLMPFVNLLWEPFSSASTLMSAITVADPILLLLLSTTISILVANMLKISISQY